MKIKISYLKIKMYWNRANSHLAIPLSIIEKLVLVFAGLRLLNLPIKYSIFLTIVFGTLLIFAILFAGYLDVKFGLYSKENSLNNEQNKELMEALKK